MLNMSKRLCAGKIFPQQSYLGTTPISDYQDRETNHSQEKTAHTRAYEAIDCPHYRYRRDRRMRGCLFPWERMGQKFCPLFLLLGDMNAVPSPNGRSFG